MCFKNVSKIFKINFVFTILQGNIVKLLSRAAFGPRTHTNPRHDSGNLDMT